MISPSPEAKPEESRSSKRVGNALKRATDCQARVSLDILLLVNIVDIVDVI